MSRIPFFWAVLVGSLALDQGLKAWTRGRLAEGQSLDLPWPGIFEIKHVTNQGIAFGMFQGMAILLTPIAVAIAVYAIFHSLRNPRESYWMHLAMAFLAAGALGNLYDRVAKGGVTDMFWFRAINFPVFNVADVCITLATVLLILRWSFEAIGHKHEAADTHRFAIPGVSPPIPNFKAQAQEDGHTGNLGTYSKEYPGATALDPEDTESPTQGSAG